MSISVKQTHKAGTLLASVLLFLGASVNVFAMTDTDADTVPDTIEVAEGTDPNDPEDYLDGEADNDGVEDLLEAGVFPFR